METIKFIKTNDGDYININHITKIRIARVDTPNDRHYDWAVNVHTTSTEEDAVQIHLACSVGDKDIAVEICCAIANFMQSDDRATLFCVPTYVSKMWPEEFHLKLVTNNGAKK